MKRFVLVFLMTISAGLAAKSNELFFTDQQQFENFHTSLIEILIERERQERYFGQVLTPKQQRELHSSVLNFFIEAAHAGRKKGDMCFFGGWPTFRVGRLCNPPWNFASDEELASLGPRYDRGHWCGAKNLFRCNPLIFGPGETGKGICITISNKNKVSQMCHDHLKNNEQDRQRLFRKFESDPTFREQYIRLSKEIMQFCEDNPKYSACQYLKNTVHDFYQAACEKQEPKVDVEAVEATQSDVIKVLDHLEEQPGNEAAQVQTPAAPTPSSSGVTAMLEERQTALTRLTKRLGIDGDNPTPKPEQAVRPAEATGPTPPSKSKQQEEIEHITYRPPEGSAARQINLETQPQEEPQAEPAKPQTFREQIAQAAAEQAREIEEEEKRERLREQGQTEEEERAQRMLERARVHLKFAAEEKRVRELNDIAQAHKRLIIQETGFTPRAAPGSSAAVVVQIPTMSNDNAKRTGYYTYGAAWKRFGTERTTWQVQQAGLKLVASNSGIYMGIGNISKEGGGRLRPHATHRYGKDVDLRLITHNGIADASRVWWRNYSREKTAEMLINLISIDPGNIERIIVNDPELHRLVRQKYKVRFQTDRNYLARRRRHRNNPKRYSIPAHDHHIHVTFRK